MTAPAAADGRCAAPDRYRARGAVDQRGRHDWPAAGACLVEARTPMNLAVLRPVLDALRWRILASALQFTGPTRADLRAAFEELGVADRVIGRDEAHLDPRSISTSTPTRGKR